MSLPLPLPCDFALIEGTAMQGSEYRRLSASFEPNSAMHSPTQLQAYGQACRAAALEEATEAAIDACGFNGASVQLEAHIREAIKRLK